MTAAGRAATVWSFDWIASALSMRPGLLPCNDGSVYLDIRVWVIRVGRLGNMDRPSHDSRRLSYRNGGYRYILSVDDDYLIVDCQRSTYSKVTKTPLKTLKAELATERWISDYSRGRAYEVRYLLAVAVVVFFSDVNKYVPLLAPACVVLAAMAMHRAFQASWPLTKTVIRNDHDEYVTSLPHIDTLQSQRKAFEETLLRFIIAARNEEHAP